MGKMFERRTPGKFNLRPQYWDPDKEEREERERRINAKLGKETDPEDEPISYGESIRGKFTQKLAQHKMQRNAASGKRIVRLFFILVIVFLIVMYVMAKNADKLVEWIGD